MAAARSKSLSETLITGALGGGSVVALAWGIDAIARGRKTARLHRVLVELLLNVLSAGDPVTERHSRRVADIADVLFRSYRLPRREHSTHRVAALLHDMGKIDDRFFPILHSCEPLSAEERKMIEQHPHEGADILEPLETIHPGLAALVAAHHECWDGSGYPKGLKGAEIPLGARIISVADVFDALSQPRPYHSPLPFDEALKLIRRGAGTRFDPEVVGKLEDPHIRGHLIAIARVGRAEEEAWRLKSRRSQSANN